MLIDREILAENLALDREWNIKAFETLRKYIHSTKHNNSSSLYTDQRFQKSFYSYFIDTKANSSNQIHTLYGTATMTEMREILQLYLNICSDEDTVETLLEYNCDIKKYLKSCGIEKHDYKHIRYITGKGFTLFRKSVEDQKLPVSVYFHQ